MRELFIYFKAYASNEHLVRAHIRAIQKQLCRDEPGLIARCLRRPNAQNQQHTWMEIYSHSTAVAGVDQRLENLINTAAESMNDLIVGPRHTEAFVVTELD